MIPVSISDVPRTLVIVASVGLAGAGAQGCEPAPPEPDGPVGADTYVEVMSELADLKRFPPPGPDYVTRSARADSVRQAILDRHGVTVDELLSYAEQVGAEPGRMLELTDRISTITDSLAREHRTAGGDSLVAPSADSTDASGAAARAYGSGNAGAGAAPPQSPSADTALAREKLERLRERFDEPPEKR
ncbi:MAG: hypothetical protein PVF05_12225 [Gemmatimonadales bacterium]|jgi:hypothetical protein